MTRSDRSPVTRETTAHYLGRALIVTLSHSTITLREKGRRTAYTLDVSAAYWRAVKEAVAAAKADKCAARKSSAKPRAGSRKARP